MNIANYQSKIDIRRRFPMERKRLFTLFGSLVLILILAAAASLAGCAQATPTTSAPAPPATSAAPAPTTSAAPAPTTSAAPAPTTSAAPAPSTTAPATSAAAPKTLKVGALFGLTGFYSVEDQVQAAEVGIVVKMINDAGGIKVQGQQYNIDLVTYDFKSTMDGVAAGANQLVFQDKVQYLIAPSAFFSPPTKDITEPNKVLRILTWITGTRQELGPDMPYTFLANNSHFDEVIDSLTLLKQLYPNVKTLSYLYPDDGTQNFIFPKDKVTIEQNGYTVVGDMINFANETTDFSPIATKAVSLKPDAILVATGSTGHGGNILKAVRQMGSTLPVIFSGNSTPSDIVAIAGESAANNYFGTGLFAGAPNMPALMQQIIEKDFAQYGVRGIRLLSSNALYLIKYGIEKAQSLDPTAVKNALETTDAYESLFGTSRLGGMQTYGIKHAFSHPDEIWTLVNGKPVFGSWEDKSPLP
jgi:branched-chain amino acid transport system substrate-binding protein